MTIEREVYKEWALHGDVVYVPSRDVLLCAYRDAVDSGNTGRLFAHVFIARAYVAGLNKVAGDGAYAVGMCSMPLDATAKDKHRMMFAWCVERGHRYRMDKARADIQGMITASLQRIAKKKCFT